jgi:hypothetical protein
MANLKTFAPWRLPWPVFKTDSGHSNNTEARSKRSTATLHSSRCYITIQFQSIKTVNAFGLFKVQGSTKDKLSERFHVSAIPETSKRQKGTGEFTAEARRVAWQIDSVYSGPPCE